MRWRTIAALVVVAGLCLAVATQTGQLPQAYADVRERNLRWLDLREAEDLLFTLTFDTKTKWPQPTLLPEGFDPAELLELGKEPGLGIRELQALGFTGAGVTVAYIDQALLLNHSAYDNVKLHYEELLSAKPSMHGPAVLSLLAGREIGIIPEAEVYFFAHNGGQEGNKYEALALERIVELNAELPPGKKIRVVGISHAPDDSVNKEYADQLRAAEKKARDSGIIVVDCNYPLLTAGVRGYGNREDYRSYKISPWLKDVPEPLRRGRLIVPADGRTTAAGYLVDPDHYVYWAEGGFSWAVPYVVGLIAMALQIDPDLTAEGVFFHLHSTAHEHLGGDFANPRAFWKALPRQLGCRSSPVLPNGDLLSGSYHFSETVSVGTSYWTLSRSDSTLRYLEHLGAKNVHDLDDDLEYTYSARSFKMNAPSWPEGMVFWSFWWETYHSDEDLRGDYQEAIISARGDLSMSAIDIAGTKTLMGPGSV
jgi:hypothetical protein